jgi:hypothetical protein
MHLSAIEHDESDPELLCFKGSTHDDRHEASNQVHILEAPSGAHPEHLLPTFSHELYPEQPPWKYFSERGSFTACLRSTPSARYGRL